MHVCGLLLLLLLLKVYDAPLKLRCQQLRFVGNALQSARLKSYVRKIEKEAVVFFDAWGKSGEIDLLKALSELTILTASRCLHGNEVMEEESVAFVFDQKLILDLPEGA